MRGTKIKRMDSEELNKLFTTSEKHLEKLGLKGVKVTYEFDKSNKVFTLDRWVVLRKGIKDNLFTRGLCFVDPIYKK